MKREAEMVNDENRDLGVDKWNFISLNFGRLILQTATYAITIPIHLRSKAKTYEIRKRLVIAFLVPCLPFHFH